MWADGHELESCLINISKSLLAASSNITIQTRQPKTRKTKLIPNSKKSPLLTPSSPTPSAENDTTPPAQPPSPLISMTSAGPNFTPSSSRTLSPLMLSRLSQNNTRTRLKRKTMSLLLMRNSRESGKGSMRRLC